jgi:hypothetical protein
MPRSRPTRRGRPAALLVVAMVAVLTAGAAFAGFLVFAPLAAVPLVPLALFLAYIRRRGRAPAEPPSGGPAPPDDAGVREPRRPRPVLPMGAITLPLPDEAPPVAVRVCVPMTPAGEPRLQPR